MGQDETKKLSFRASLLTGVAIFSMFFGVGNLILPPLMGYKAGVAIVPAFIGYGLSGVVLPIMALASIARSGNMKALTSRISLPGFPGSSSSACISPSDRAWPCPVRQPLPSR